MWLPDRFSSARIFGSVSAQIGVLVFVSWRPGVVGQYSLSRIEREKSMVLEGGEASDNSLIHRD